VVKFLKREDIPGLLGRLSERFRVYVPVKRAEVVLWRPWREGVEPALEHQGTEPPKAVLFPRSETLLRFGCEGKEVEVEETIEAPPTVIFGSRPCDARGFLIYDRVFLDERNPDPYYRARREATTIITILCLDPEGTCFCSTVGGGPLDEEGSDLVLLPLKGGYLAKALTPKGEALLEDGAFVEASEGQLSEAERLRERAKMEPLLELDGVPERFTESFTSDLWERVSQKCISCGACTFLCPTCYCFNITDERTPEGAERLRNWDACMFYHYTLEASGHNPRPTKAERYRNRIGHKFSYYPSLYEGLFACCGCGRCIKSCPVSLDIREVLRELVSYGK